MKLVALMLLVGSASVFAADLPGKAPYEKSCKNCHGLDGKANPAIAKMMKVEMKHLGDKAVQARSDADLKKIVTEGEGKMKGIKSLSEKEVGDVVAYIRTFKS